MLHFGEQISTKVGLQKRYPYHLRSSTGTVHRTLSKVWKSKAPRNGNISKSRVAAQMKRTNKGHNLLSFFPSFASYMEIWLYESHGVIIRLLFSPKNTNISSKRSPISDPVPAAPIPAFPRTSQFVICKYTIPSPETGWNLLFPWKYGAHFLRTTSNNILCINT